MLVDQEQFSFIFVRHEEQDLFVHVVVKALHFFHHDARCGFVARLRERKASLGHKLS